jgi:molybdate transport system permease protein
VNLDRGIDILRDRAAVRKIAIANPEHAPYGRAAKAILENSGIWAEVQDRIVQGENIAQTAQFVRTGNVDAGFAGLVLGSMLYSLPFAIQPFQSALRGIPRFLIEAAELEANPIQVFWHVRIPLALRGIMVGATLAFAHTIGEFGVVMMIGGSIPGITKVASVALYNEVQKPNCAVANQYAVVLLVLSFSLLLAVVLIQRHSRWFDL